MPTANIVAVYRENGRVCMEVTVDEGDQDKYERVNHHVYTGSVPDDEAFNSFTTAQKKTALVAACKAVRAAQVTRSPPALLLAGPVVL